MYFGLSGALSSLKASYSSDQYSISLLDSSLFPASSSHRGKGQTGTYPSGTSSAIMRVCHGLAIHHPELLSNHSDTISLLYKLFTMLMLCIGDSPPSCLLPFAYKGLFLVYLKALRFLYIFFLFNYSGE